MDVHEFVRRWKEDINQGFVAFEINLQRTNPSGTKSYTDWIKTWLAWNELATDEDIDASYDWLNDEYPKE